MQFFLLPALLLLQDDSGLRSDVHLSTVFIGILAVVSVLQIAVLAVVAYFAAKLLTRLAETVKRVEDKAGPIIDKVGVVVTDLVPKIHTIGANVEGMSYIVRAKVDEIGQTVTKLNETVQEINGRTRVHVARVDGIVTNAVTTTEEISDSVAQGIKAPIKQIAGVLAGVRAGLDTLIARSPFGRS